MLPEIARRCESCGAAIRVHAIFCPQCGVPLKREEQKSSSGGIGVPELKMEDRDDKLKTKSIMTPPTAVEQVSGTNVVEPAAEVVPAAAPQTEISQGKIEEATPVKSGSEAGTEKKRQRVAAAARERVQENLRPRVEKLKQTSAVVLDEAAEDPGLRFVLVAALLVILSLILLLLSLVR
ncbi:MAG: hypothetical protein AUG51_05055 [Acidobacteria bacterium 13_1_20CM_3_53_8]|nr:MAG: hypothetical protein AUG51_05055 [Acidobacteria bacterium 13_1_20CM_3_53_8]